ncbi:addiction module protein [Gracilimonas mengyeensis]|uniref:Addiction module component n=1 Tax=Gracilimonas mengyeensis TaxID=1302730 RepID=A0A521AYT3_9BACT|nr:addiction module protein [Gracilimonas mengyeensis]SMO39997.1 Putative addiction module component [Gracilimonas mengyeensis]
METEKLRERLKEEIQQLEGDLLQYISMFIYNWTEGSWTPPPLTDEQLEEIKRRAEEIEHGEVEMISSEELWKSLKEKYGFVREDQEEYLLEREQEEKEDLRRMLDELNRKHLIWIEVFLESHRSSSGWEELPEAAKASILRGKEDAKAGRHSDAFKYLKEHG